MRGDSAGAHELKIAFSNSSPLILFTRIGRLEILNALLNEVLVPPAVWKEVVIAGSGRAGAQAVREAEWIRLAQLPAGGLLQRFSSLDLREAEVLTLASFHGPDLPLLLDDLRARSVALNLGFPVIGSAGILVRAKERGALPSVRPVLTELREAGLFISDSTVTTLLELAEES